MGWDDWTRRRQSAAAALLFPPCILVFNFRQGELIADSSELLAYTPHTDTHTSTITDQADRSRLTVQRCKSTKMTTRLADINKLSLTAAVSPIHVSNTSICSNFRTTAADTFQCAVISCVVKDEAKRYCQLILWVFPIFSEQIKLPA
eukprot:scaffold120359_cov42-Prasinocladus_malaysianus.AAC.1